MEDYCNDALRIKLLTMQKTDNLVIYSLSNLRECVYIYMYNLLYAH